MQVVILAGGLGTRLSEETRVCPKPMVEIGGKPILHHIMEWYAKFGHTKFIICCGYKGSLIKEYFSKLHYSGAGAVSFDTYTGEQVIRFGTEHPKWDVTCVETGPDTMTGGRIARIKEYLDPKEPFMLTYGDGVSNIDLDKVLFTHLKNEKALITVSAVPSPSRFGLMYVEDDGRISSFVEKPLSPHFLVNAGYSICSPRVFDMFPDINDYCVWEQHVLSPLAERGMLQAYVHEGFWKPMDTLKDKQELEEMYEKLGHVYG